MNRPVRALTVGAILVATSAIAETEVDAYGLGGHPPNPEVWVKMDDELSVRVRIVRDRSGELADAVARPEVLRLELSFTVAPGATDRDVHFNCQVRFMDAEARSSEVVAKGPCYDGRLSDGSGVFQPMDFKFRFKPNLADPAGTSGVKVQFGETGSGIFRTLTPTYDWTGGM
jgi:hypothetical protein